MTCQSEVGLIKSVLLKRPEDAFRSQELLRSQWADLSFLDEPDLENAIQEFKAFEDFLKKNLATIHYLSKDDHTTIDSLYTRDASIATDHGMILCNMGKPSRANEPEAQRHYFTEHQIKVLGQIRSPGTLEGGDCAWLDTRTLAVGESYRTNAEGINQLRHMLAPFEISILVVLLPHYKGPQDVFHLMSIFSPIDNDLAVVYSRLMPVGFRNEVLRRGYNLVEVPESEFESMACNVLAVAPRKCIILKGNPMTTNLLQKAGCKVFDYEGREISIKGGGGPTCLTRPMEREE